MERRGGDEMDREGCGGEEDAEDRVS